MKRTVLLYIGISLLATTAFAQVHTSPSYTLLGARIVTSGGSASSLSYTLNNVKAGSIFGGTAESANFTLNTSHDSAIRAPQPPTLGTIISPTNISTQTLTGNKSRHTSIHIDGFEVVPLNANTTWSCEISLEEGDNKLCITARNKQGMDSEAVSTNIIRDTVPPNIVINNPLNYEIFYASEITIKGTIDGVSFTENHDLNLGLNDIVIEATDAAGNTATRIVTAYRVRAPIALPQMPF